MTAVALACAVAAVLFRIGPSSGRALQTRLGAGRGRGAGRARRVGPVLLAVLLAVGLVGVMAALSGARGAVLALTGLLVVGVVTWLVRARRRARDSLRAQVEVAHACQVLASHLRVGQVPTEALATAAADCPVLTEAHQVHEVGGDVTAVWQSQGRRPGHGGLLELTRAWRVSARTGAPLSTTLDQVARSLSAEESLRAVVAGELASPRATSKVMAALPVCGIGLGYLLGGDPIQWLLAGPAGWACLLGGVLLAGAGVIWIELLARQSSAQG